MNVNLVEYGIIRDVLMDEDHPEDIAPDVVPSQQPVHWNMIPVYQWKYIDGEKGEVMRTSSMLFFNRDNCVQDGVESGQDMSQRCEMKVDVQEVLSNTMEVLVHKVYAHLLQQEFKWRVTQQCYGCQNDRDSQREHMSLGCMDDRETLVDLHARPCHLRITKWRLHEAVREVMPVFNMTHIDRNAVRMCLESTSPKQVLKESSIMYHEFEKLYKF